MITAKDIMTTEVITISPEAKVTEAARKLLEHRINGLPVVDENGRLVGIICRSDLIAQQKRIPLPSLFNLLDSFIPMGSFKNYEKEMEKIAAITVAQAMTPGPVTVGIEDSLEKIAGLMVDKNLHTIPVLRYGKLVGIIGKEDVLQTLMSREVVEQVQERRTRSQ